MKIGVKIGRKSGPDPQFFESKKFMISHKTTDEILPEIVYWADEYKKK